MYPINIFSFLYYFQFSWNGQDPYLYSKTMEDNKTLIKNLQLQQHQLWSLFNLKKSSTKIYFGSVNVSQRTNKNNEHLIKLSFTHHKE